MKRLIARLLAAAFVLTLMCGTLTGCAANDWKGTWNRTGDATYSRAFIEIFDVSRKGFSFDMTLYNGNVAGEIEDAYALFLDRTCEEAVYDVPGSYATITFTMNPGGDIDVIYMGGTSTANYVIEPDIFGFAAPAYITGNFVRRDVTYINSSFADTGMLTEEEDSRVRKIMPDDVYARCLDCFQFWTLGSGKTLDKHDDELGAFVYFGSNQMQEHGAVIIIFDDGTVAVIVSRADGSLVYYCDNHIYGTGEVYPLPIKDWMTAYYAEQEK